MNQPLYNPKPTQTLASTDLRQNMAQTFADLNSNRGAMVVTVAHRPRVVITDFAAYSELLYRAQR